MEINFKFKVGDKVKTKTGLICEVEGFAYEYYPDGREFKQYKLKEFDHIRLYEEDLELIIY